MQTQQHFWHVCVERDSCWEVIESDCGTRADAEAELRKERAVWPNAFVVRITMTRMDTTRFTPTLTAV